MRFDYQPALANFKILKTSKQRKLFFIIGTSVIGCLIILSSIARTLIHHKRTLNYDIYKSNQSNSDLMIVSKSQEISLTNIKSRSETKQHISHTEDASRLINLRGDQIKVATSVLDLNTPNLGSLNIDRSAVEDEAKWETAKINFGDTIISILQNFSMPKVYLKDFSNFIKTNSVCKNAIANIKAGYIVKILFDEDRNLKSIKLPLAPHKSLFIDRIGPKNYKTYYEEKPIIKKLIVAHSRIKSSFYNAAQAAGLNDNLIMEMADIFGWDIDFSMDIRPNDKFKVLYEEKYVDQEKIGTGHILAAEFINQGQKYQAVRFTDLQGRVSYYTPEGYSMNKTFLRNPVKFTRIGSKFSISRHHPILHRLRAHKGVDYVAPSGTPVKAAGDGKVILIGRKGGYGNVIELLHGNKYSTLYAHLSSFASGIKKDQVVRQGQVIGYVGKTGLATGDHLHYEFRVDGIHRDPLTVQFPKSMPLPNKYKSKFLSHSQQMISLLNENDVTTLKS